METTKTRKTNPKKTTAYSLDPEVIEAVAEAAWRARMSRSALVNQLLRTHLDLPKS